VKVKTNRLIYKTQ